MSTDGGCGCEARKAWLNDLWPGLGDLVERVIAVILPREKV